MTRTTRHGLTHQACHLITALACLSTLIVIDAWVLLSFALIGREVTP